MAREIGDQGRPMRGEFPARNPAEHPRIKTPLRRDSGGSELRGHARFGNEVACIGLNFPVLLQTSPRLTHEPRGIYSRAEVSLKPNIPNRESIYRIPRLTKNQERKKEEITEEKEGCSIWGKAGHDSPVYTVIPQDHWRSWGTLNMRANHQRPG